MENAINNCGKMTRIKDLMGEIMRDEHMIDKLLNSSYSFERKSQAMYFTNMKKNMQSDMVKMVVLHGQFLEDVKILEGMKKHGR